MTTNETNVFSELTKPFGQSEIKFRAGATTKDKTRALALAYVDARAIMDRLDATLTPIDWKDEYRPIDGGFICRLSIRIDGEWISKEDAAPQTDYEGIKGGISDAFKRAAVKFGIGRHLYDLPSVWVSCETKGKSVILDQKELQQKIFGSFAQAQPAPAQPQQPANGNVNARSPKTQFANDMVGELGISLQELTNILKLDNGFNEAEISRQREFVRFIVKLTRKINPADLADLTETLSLAYPEGFAPELQEEQYNFVVGHFGYDEIPF
jgi:hypothetical protein